MEQHRYESIQNNVHMLEDVRTYEEACRVAASECSSALAGSARNAGTRALADEFRKKSQEHRSLRDWCAKQIKSLGPRESNSA